MDGAVCGDVSGAAGEFEVCVVDGVDVSLAAAEEGGEGGWISVDDEVGELGLVVLERAGHGAEVAGGCGAVGGDGFGAEEDFGSLILPEGVFE